MLLLLLQLLPCSKGKAIHTAAAAAEALQCVLIVKDLVISTCSFLSSREGIGPLMSMTVGVLQAAQVRKSSFVPAAGVVRAHIYHPDTHHFCTVHAGTYVQQVRLCNTQLWPAAMWAVSVCLSVVRLSVCLSGCAQCFSCMDHEFP